MKATDTAAHLERLAGELRDRGWHVTVRTVQGRRPALHVRNPRAPRLNDEVVADDAAFRWTWGQGIGPLTETPGVADRIQYVLREADAVEADQ
ncbi:hypothetical protein [Actinomadura roseirufa]|uniref:hypothetical protein n=1 Tax=Actinomadura roseirufa TaxID=2094049 RepID=UPI00104155BC|nr:hypothetical protein [Actinomadura roseirufa]